MDFIYFLTETGRIYHSTAHDPGSGFLLCSRDVCKLIREQIRTLVEETI